MQDNTDRWQQHYNNAAELFFGKIAGDTLTEAQDAICIADADAVLATEEHAAAHPLPDPFAGIPQPADDPFTGLL